ncbi:MAG: iron-containing alcohol dehydrogenase [Synergistales bacterium]|nr:iron-containing alcohol dehydrogenase [Synergistales bacterium]
MKRIAYYSPPALLLGRDIHRELPEQLSGLGCSRPFVITDPGIARAGILQQVLDVLREAGMEPGSFDGVEPEPALELTEQVASRIADGPWDVLVGLGGGSSIDVTKVAALLATNGPPARRFVGVNQVPEPGLPTVMLPTTAGTGSEVTRIGVFGLQDEGGIKKGIVSPHMLASLAMIDPSFTYSMPPKVTGHTGMDALVHAIESYVSRGSNDFTEELSLSAIELVGRYLRKAVADGEDEESRYYMSLASLKAGLAFANAGLGAVHGLSLTLGGQYHLPHGLVNSLMLPYVMEANLMSELEKYADIAEALGEATEHLSLREAAATSVDAVLALATDIGLPTRLREVEVPEEAPSSMAQSAVNETRLLSRNPKQLDIGEIEGIYRNAW